MTARFAWVSMLVTAATGVAVLLSALAFVPSSAWESFVPIATVLGGAGVLIAAAAIGWTGNRLARPLRRIIQAIETDELGQQSLRQFAGDAPSEIAALLYALHGAHAHLQRALAELERDRGQMAIIFQHMADGLLVLDRDERIELSNLAAERLLRGPALTGRRLAAVAADAELIELARAARDGHAAVQVVELRAMPAGPRRWLQVAATRLPDRERTLVLLQDVTDLRRAEAARRDFVGNVSHELRTPVASLKALVETLEAGALDDPEAAPDFLRRMHVEVDGLAQLVSELLELARIEAGRLELDLSDCRADDLMRAAVDRIHPFAARLGLDLRLEPPPASADLWVRADARRVGQVFSNLLANAVKFTPPGGRIVVGAAPSDGWAELWVADTGVGIAPDQLLRVFERFYKIDPSRTGSGTGLGLAICKHIVRGHGGSIWAESDGLGCGATFRFTLPTVPGRSSLRRGRARRGDKRLSRVGAFEG